MKEPCQPIETCPLYELVDIWVQDHEANSDSYEPKQHRISDVYLTEKFKRGKPTTWAKEIGYDIWRSCDDPYRYTVLAWAPISTGP